VFHKPGIVAERFVRLANGIWAGSEEIKEMICLFIAISGLGNRFSQ